jgi:hypothetical protein
MGWNEKGRQNRKTRTRHIQVTYLLFRYQHAGQENREDQEETKRLFSPDVWQGLEQ